MVINDLDELSKQYYEFRQSLIEKYQIGLTKIYNKFHDAHDVSTDTNTLRELHRQLDSAVTVAYGWQDIPLDHAFHSTKQGTRFTISELARKEVLRRLLDLNHQRYAEEVAQGIHADATPHASRRTARSSRSANANANANANGAQQTSLDFEAGAAAVKGANPTVEILGFLCAHDGWHAKADVLAATGITDGQWNIAIAELIAGSKVERQGERRGARYRLIGFDL